MIWMMLYAAAMVAHYKIIVAILWLFMHQRFGWAVAGVAIWFQIIQSGN